MATRSLSSLEMETEPRATLTKRPCLTNFKSLLEVHHSDIGYHHIRGVYYRDGSVERIRACRNSVSALHELLAERNGRLTHSQSYPLAISTSMAIQHAPIIAIGPA